MSTQKTPQRRMWSWWPVLGWMLLIFIGSSIPSQSIPKIWAFRFDKVVHAALYAALGALVCRAVGGRVWRAVLFGVLVATIYGASDELHQRLVPGRSPDVRDWIADMIGGLVGSLAWAAFKWQRFVRRASRKEGGQHDSIIPGQNA